MRTPRTLDLDNELQNSHNQLTEIHLKPADHVFTDMNQMQSFLALNEEAKSQFMPSTEENHVLHDLNTFWNVDRAFEG